MTPADAQTALNLDGVLERPHLRERGMDATMVNGLFTAALSCPGGVTLNDALPWVFDAEQGEHPPAFTSPTERMDVLTLLTQHWSDVQVALKAGGEIYSPVFVEENGVLTVRRWCLGYYTGMGLAPEPWAAVVAGEPEPFITTILLHATEEGQAMLERLKLSPKEYGTMPEILTQGAVAMFRHRWPA